MHCFNSISLVFAITLPITKVNDDNNGKGSTLRFLNIDGSAFKKDIYHNVTSCEYKSSNSFITCKIAAQNGRIEFVPSVKRDVQIPVTLGSVNKECFNKNNKNKYLILESQGQDNSYTKTDVLFILNITNIRSGGTFKSNIFKNGIKSQRITLVQRTSNNKNIKCQFNYKKIKIINPENKN